MADQESELDKIRSQLNSMELRIRRLESTWAYSDEGKTIITGKPAQKVKQDAVSDDLAGEEKGLESQIGRFGLAWMGNIVLLFGITFLTQYLMNLGHQLARCHSGLYRCCSYLFPV